MRTRSTTVAVIRRSAVAPVGPSVENRLFASAAPVCTETTAPSTRAGAGTRPPRPELRPAGAERRLIGTSGAGGLDLAERRHGGEQAYGVEQPECVVVVRYLGQHRAEVAAAGADREHRA